MEQEKLSEILQAHKKWLDSDGKEGVRADLRNVNLFGADMREADLGGVDMDHSVLPLWDGGLHMHVDDRIGTQILFHAVENILYSKNTSAELKKAVSHPDIIAAVNKFHRVDECGEVKPYYEVKSNAKP